MNGMDKSEWIEREARRLRDEREAEMAVSVIRWIIALIAAVVAIALLYPR